MARWACRRRLSALCAAAVRSVLLIALALALPPGCASDDATRPARLELRVLFDDSAQQAARPGLPGASPSRAISRAMALVLDASGIPIVGGIPVSAPYQSLIQSYQPPVLSWPSWRALLGARFPIVAESELHFDGQVADGVLAAAIGWNLVAIAFLDSTAVSWIGIAPGFAQPGVEGTVTLRVAPPRGYSLPGTGPLVMQITVPTDGQNVTSPTLHVTGQVNDPFLTAGTISLRPGVASTVLPLQLGSFAADVALHDGPDTIIVAATRPAPLSGSNADTVIVVRKAPLVITIDQPPQGVVTTRSAVDLGGTINDSQADSVVVLVNGKPVGPGWLDGSAFGYVGVPLDLGVNTIRAEVSRGAEIAASETRLTRRAPLSLTRLQIGQQNNNGGDANLGVSANAVVAVLPKPQFLLSGTIPAGSQISLRWITGNGTGPWSFTVYYENEQLAFGTSQQRATSDPTTWTLDTFDLPVRAIDTDRLFTIAFDGFSGSVQFDWIAVRVGNERVTFGAQDDSPLDLDWGALNSAAGSQRSLAFTGEITTGPVFSSGVVRWSPGSTGPAAGEGIQWTLDGQLNASTPLQAPSANLPYYSDALYTSGSWYGDHQFTVDALPLGNRSAGVTIDFLQIEFQASLGKRVVARTGR